MSIFKLSDGLKVIADEQTKIAKVSGYDNRMSDPAVTKYPVTAITVPSTVNGEYSVRKISDGALINIKNIERVTIATGVREIGESAFSGSSVSSVFAGFVNKIGACAFLGCKNLKEVKISESLKSLGYRAFAGSGIESVSIPGSVEKIESHTFFNCPNLKSVEIGNGVKEIGLSAFAKCPNLTNVIIPDSVEKIDPDVFLGSNKENITIHCSAAVTNRFKEFKEEGIKFSVNGGAIALAANTVKNSIDNIIASAREKLSGEKTPLSVSRDIHGADRYGER